MTPVDVTIPDEVFDAAWTAMGRKVPAPANGESALLQLALAAALPEHERMVREQVAKDIDTERDDVASNEGATIADERVITSRCNGLAHAARIARGGI